MLTGLFFLQACSTGWYYEVTAEPPGGCVSYQIEAGKKGRACGLRKGMRYQVDAFYGGGKADRIENMLVKIRPISWVIYASENPPGRLLMQYGTFVKGRKVLSRYDTFGLSMLLLFIGLLALSGLRKRSPLAVVLRPPLYALWGVTVAFGFVSLGGDPLATYADEISYQISMSLLWAAVGFVLLPWSARKHLKMSATEAILQAYFTLKGADAVQARRREYMRERR